MLDRARQDAHRPDCVGERQTREIAELHALGFFRFDDGKPVERFMRREPFIVVRRTSALSMSSILSRG